MSDGVMLSAPVYAAKDRPLSPASVSPASVPSAAAPVNQVVAPLPQVQAQPQAQAQAQLPAQQPVVSLTSSVVMGVPVLAGAEKDAFARQTAALPVTATPVTSMPVAAPVPPAEVAPSAAPVQAASEAPRAPALDASVQLMASAPEPVAVSAPVVVPAAPAPVSFLPPAAPKAVEAPRESRLTLAATIKAITPSNYRLEFAPDVQKDLIVDAPEAGQPWSMQLDTLARAHGLRVEASRGVVVVSVAQAGMAPPDTSTANVPMTLAPVQPPVPVPAVPAAVAPVPAPVPAPVSEAQIKLEASPVPPPAPRPAVAATEKPAAATILWRAGRGQTLMEVLQAWSDQAGVQLYWDSKYDYPLQASLALSGSFEDAVRVILEGFDGASPQPVGKLHRQGNAGSRVLIIQSRGNIYGMR